MQIHAWLGVRSCSKDGEGGLAKTKSPSSTTRASNMSQLGLLPSDSPTASQYWLWQTWCNAPEATQRFLDEGGGGGVVKGKCMLRETHPSTAGALIAVALRGPDAGGAP